MAAQPPPDKQKKQLALVGVLLAVFLLLLAYNLKRSSATKARRRQAVSTVSQPTTPLSETPPAAGNVPSPSETEEVTLAALREKAKELKWGRDPFILSLREEGGLPTLQLKVTGIIYDVDHPEATYAIINEEVVRIGDDIRGIKVIDIQADAVRLKKFNQEFTLYLYQEPKPK